MKLNPNPALYPYVLDPGFVQLINNVLEDSNIDDAQGLVLNFRDPNYSAESGGYHPVEVAINGNGKLLYLTDFYWAGAEPYVELAKELDFDFSQGIFQQYSRTYPIIVSQGLWTLYVRNFVAYHAMGVYETTISPL